MPDSPRLPIAPSPRLRVLLADDHALFLEGLKNLLTGRGVDVVGTAHNGLEALEKARQLSPEIILMDIRMPGCDGLAATRLIKAEMPQIKIIMLTTSTVETDLFEAIRSGASGYLLKSLEAAPFLTYLEGAARGEAAISREMAGFLLKELARQAEPVAQKAPNTQEAHLTPRQIEILQWVAQGLPYKEVAERLCMSEHTVKYHMGEILQRLHLKNRDEVMAYALRTGLFRSAKPDS
jgi:two-component system NarL family response regulator